MFGAGWTEMLIIGIVALVVIGPKDLPVVMRKLGRVVRTVRRMGEEFQSELSKTTGLDQITDLKRSITEPLRQSSDDIMREFNRQTTTGVEPTGIVKPTDPNVESVYDQIAATSGLPTAPATPPMMATTGTAASSVLAEVLPAPAEAAPAAAKPRRTSTRKPAKTAPSTVEAPVMTPIPATPIPETAEAAPKQRAQRPRKAVAAATPSSPQAPTPPARKRAVAAATTADELAAPRRRAKKA
jgi:sec-independent protein translocase protein TatB